MTRIFDLRKRFAQTHLAKISKDVAPRNIAARSPIELSRGLPNPAAPTPVQTVANPIRASKGSASTHLTLDLLVIYLRANQGTGHLAWGYVPCKHLSRYRREERLMRIMTKIVLAAAAVLSIGMAGKSATAMTVATPAAISIAATDAALIGKAAYRGHHYGWHRGHHYGWYHHHHGY